MWVIPISGIRVGIIVQDKRVRTGAGSDDRRPNLEKKLRFEGFFFGCYDVRCPEAVDIRTGNGFKIVELNGVTSEATHIHDPRNSLWEVYRVLIHQWRLAFSIGDANRRREVQPTPLRVLLSRLTPRR